MNDRPPDGQAPGRPPLDVARGDPELAEGPPGLCAGCKHMQRVTSARGSTFYLCRRSFTDPRFARYPPIPVLVCAGFEPGDAGGDDQVR